MRNNPLLKTVMVAIAEQTSGSKAYVSETNLAEKISISRTRLRETLQTLNVYGLIEKRQKLGIAIRPVTRESVKETYELRELLEGQAMKSALEHVTAENITQLYNFEATIKLATQTENLAMATQYDLEFHRKIIDISGLTLLQQILDNLHLIENSFANVVAHEAEAAWHPEKPNPYGHHAIVVALEQRDPKCVNLLKKHIQWIKKQELKKFDKQNKGQAQSTTTHPITQGGTLSSVAVNY
ncbi:MAG: GntR family transcriptional regulator [Victivallaceae bacterium]|nr:GntR family transcriptional regulator [Victivallaceae bacterium]